MRHSFVRKVKVKTAGKSFCKPDWSWDTPVFTDYDLWFVLDGQGALTASRKTYSLQAGDCFVLRKRERYIGRQNPDYPLVVIYSHFDFYDESGEALGGIEAEIPRFHRKLKNYHFFSELMERMVKAAFNNRQEESSEWFRVALMELSIQDKQTDVGVEHTEISDFIEKLAREVREHPGEHYGLRQIARKACYSPDHFSRLFKRITGHTFRDFVLHSRMDAAKFLLKSSNYSITRISEILGYQDVYLFSKQFKSREGIPPTDYRARSTRTKEPLELELS